MDKGTRIINFGIDLVIISIINNILIQFVNSASSTGIVYFCYYFILESIFGQTIGKMITKTKVVNKAYHKPNVWLIFIRTLLRFNPFDTASYLFGKVQGGHDVISKTRLIYKSPK